MWWYILGGAVIFVLILAIGRYYPINRDKRFELTKEGNNDTSGSLSGGTSERATSAAPTALPSSPARLGVGSLGLLLRKPVSDDQAAQADKQLSIHIHALLPDLWSS